MNDNTKTFLLKGIPESVWREFKIKFLQDGFDTYNEALIDVIKQYTHKGK
jgi:hypothetical protein